MPFYYEDRSMNIKYRRCFFESDEHIPNYERFFSAHRKFPVSIAFPRGLSAFFDYDDRREIQLELGSAPTFLVVREDLEVIANRDPGAQAVIEGKRDVLWLMKQEFEWRKSSEYHQVRSFRLFDTPRDFTPVGAGGFKAPRLVWTNSSGQLGGEWVFFQSRQPSIVWRITWDAQAGHDRSTFAAVLSSFRWLSDEYYRTLGL